MSTEEQDAILGRAVRELASLRREEQAIMLELNRHSQALSSWAEALKGQVEIGYTPKDPASDDLEIPGREELLSLVSRLKEVRQQILQRNGALTSAGWH